MSLHKAQIFAILSISLSLFGFLMTQVSGTFNAICNVSQGTLNGTVINGSVSSTTSITCGSLIDSNVAFLLILMGGIAAFCALPFV